MFGMMGMWLMMLVFWGGLILLAVWLAKGLFNPTPERPPERQTPQEILRQRYARGEISRAEYEQMRHDLGA